MSKDQDMREQGPATDAPMCECGEGVLIPTMYQAGELRPNPHAHHTELAEMTCSATGDRLVVRTSRVIGAWFSVGGYEQKLFMERATEAERDPVTLRALVVIPALQARAEVLLEQTTTQETAEQLSMIAQAFDAISCAVQVALGDEWADAGLHFEELAERTMRPVVAWQGGQ